MKENNVKRQQLLEDKSGKEHIIEIKGLCKSFDDSQVLKDITFYIRNNEFITLLGPSGCGKSTTLRIIAGFETADSGIVNFEGKDLKSVPANKRNINTVFQRYALFPHLDVYDNVAFGLKFKKIPYEATNRKGEKVTKYIEDHNIQTRLLFSGNLIKHPCFDEMRASGEGYRVVGNLDNTDKIINNS